MKVDSLYIYPIKSCRGIAVDQIDITPRGLANDRRWMIVDADTGQGITQRECPTLARIIVTITDTGLQIADPDHGAVIVTTPTDTPIVTANLFGKSFPGHICSPDADRFFSEVTGRACRLIYQGEHTKPVNQNRAPSAVNSYADGYPILIVNLASLADLSARVGHTVSIERFRPNIVIAGDSAWDEDEWLDLRIGDSRFRCVKPCTRCVMTTVDQQTGRKETNEPLRTLTIFRMLDDKALQGAVFGQNVMPIAATQIRVGDAFEVLTRQPKPQFKMRRVKV